MVAAHLMPHRFRRSSALLLFNVLFLGVNMVYIQWFLALHHHSRDWFTFDCPTMIMKPQEHDDRAVAVADDTVLETAKQKLGDRNVPHTTVIYRKLSKQTESFKTWLEEHEDTPGARLVNLLQLYLHNSPGDENTRVNSCHRATNNPICFGGVQNARIAEQNTTCMNHHSGSLEKCTQMPLLSQVSVYKTRRFGPPQSGRLIRSLGTETVCLPLLLAGAAVQDSGIVLELGPFVGMSSRCIGLGLNATSTTDALFSFDMFRSEANYKTIMRFMNWIPSFKPDFGKDSSFLWLWQLAVHDVYPTAQGFEGMITSDTVHPGVWNDQEIAMLSIDSAKTYKELRNQLAGVGTVKQGTILALMDFLFVDIHVKMVYGCLREKYLQPVYTSWCRGEHWIFVVLQDLDLDSVVTSCVDAMLKPGEFDLSATEFDRISYQIDQDVEFLGGMFVDDSHSAAEHQACLKISLRSKIQQKPKEWEKLRSA